LPKRFYVDTRFFQIFKCYSGGGGFWLKYLIRE